VGEGVAEEPVGYPIRLPSTLATHLSLASSELVEMFDSDGSVMLHSQTGQLSGEEPSVCPDIVSLSSAESAEPKSCSSMMAVLVSVFLQFGSAVLVSDLSQRDVASKVELLQNPSVPLTHHGDSNAIGVLVHADHILHDSRGWRFLLKQPQETVVTSHQNTRDNPTVSQVLLKTSVCAVPSDWKPEPFIVRSETQDRVSTSGRLPAEEPPVKSYCCMLDLRGDLAPLPSVPLGFFDKLAGYAVCLVLRVDEVVESSVAAGLVTFDHVKCGGRNSREDAVRVLQFAVLAVREWQKVELQYLLRRYPP